MLAFDTATPAVTAALHNGERLLAEQTTVDARRQGELLATTIAALLAAAGVSRSDLDAVAVGVGPGPYTGLRTGLVTAQVLASALDIPVYGVCTLDVIARDAARMAGDREFLVATDARRRELYWARYQADGSRIGDPSVAAPGLLPPDMPAAGEGPRLYPTAFAGALAPEYPAAGTLAGLVAEAMSAHGGAGLLPPLPLYLRRPDAREPGKPKRVTPEPAAAAPRQGAGR